MKFKDKCDFCNQWKYNCKGYKNKIVCNECYKKEINNYKRIKTLDYHLKNDFIHSNKISQNSQLKFDIM